MANEFGKYMIVPLMVVPFVACSDDSVTAGNDEVGGEIGTDDRGSQSEAGESSGGETGEGDFGETESSDAEAGSGESGDAESTDSGTDGADCGMWTAQCFADAIFLVNGCDTPVFQATCEFGCSEGACTDDPCPDDFASQACFAGDIYWFDSCGAPSEVHTECAVGCANGQCTDDPELELTEIQLMIEPLTSLCPSLIEGDPNFNSAGPAVMASTQISASAHQLLAQVNFTAEETKADWTKGEYEGQHVLWDAPEGCQIMAIVTSETSVCSYTDTDHALDTCWPLAGGAVHRFEFMGDTSGPDLGSCDDGSTFGSVIFNPVTLIVQCQ